MIEKKSDFRKQKKKVGKIIIVSVGRNTKKQFGKNGNILEKMIAKAYPGYEVCHISTNRKKEGEDSQKNEVIQELEKAIKKEIKKLVVLPMHLVKGREYIELKEQVKKYNNSFQRMVFAQPLLAENRDYKKVKESIIMVTEAWENGKTAICMVGHGTKENANTAYTKLEQEMLKDGYENYYMGTLRGKPSIEEVLKKIRKKRQYEKVLLVPFMVTVGIHAKEDIAGKKETSWKSRMEREGFEVECFLYGLGEQEIIQKLYISHIKNAIKCIEQKEI